MTLLWTAVELAAKGVVLATLAAALVTVAVMYAVAIFEPDSPNN